MSSLLRGVSFNNGMKKWESRFAHGGKSFYLGSFNHEVDAAKRQSPATPNTHPTPAPHTTRHDTTRHGTA